ncbi:energy transducer TonB [Massilia sp. LXY-6]|uniref:energy transducer TonB n=1 Tax=Massilia sp. LXY-6 TaxID=3379823 RepID=UPI003EE3A351
MRGAGALILALVTASQSAPLAAQTAPTPTPAGKPCAAPDYPREAVRYELQGITTLRFHLAPDGHVADVQVARSSGWALLDEAAIRTIRSCGFTPEQAARAKGAALPVQYVWSLDGEPSIRPHLVPGSCPAAGRFASFKPYDKAPSGADGVKVRLLVDPAGKPHGVKPEGAILPPELAGALVKYVESCRFGFDPDIKGQRTDTVYGRVVFAR